MTAQAVSRGDHITLSLTSWGRLGEAMARYQGWDVFVFGGIPGETVVAEILRIQRKYLAARVVELIQGSELRVKPPCPYYGECTGCQWEHLDYPAQLTAKKNLVVDALERVGGLSHQPVAEVIPSPEQYGYRNHARFTVGPAGSLGFVNRETRRFVAIDRCMLMHQGINDLLTQLQGRCSETTQLAIRAGQNTGDYLVQPALKNPAVPLPSGQTHYVESVGDQRFRVASPSFFQVNVEQTAQLVEVVRDALDLSGGEVLVDAYAGVGTLAILLASYVANVIAIEESSAAVADARENAAALTNVEFRTGKTEELLSRLGARPDVVVLDPPRAGCQPQALRSLLEIAPEKVAYVSCDPESLARDLKILVDGGYHLDQVQPLDMFPQTHHVECMAALTLRKGYPKIILASASPRRLELLSQLGLDFQVIPSDIPEDQLDGESAEEMTRRLSLEKALAVSSKLCEGYVIGADSTVVWEGRAVGKPVDAEDARRMLRELRGTSHQVTTGVTAVDVATGRHVTDALTSDINLRDYSDAEIETSIATGTPMDKAGAYAIQDEELRPGEMVSGCYPNVIGLPICRLLEMLAELGCSLPPLGFPESAASCRRECPFRPGSES